jgi:hypothetical protein
MYWDGEDRILWASGAMAAHPQVVLEAFLDFEMPEELVQGYGFPPLTEQAKRKLLGENYCRLHGLDIEGVKAGVANDDWARQRHAATPHRPWATIREAAGPETEA